MKNEILQNVGKTEIWQKTEREEYTEETKEQELVQESAEIKALHADENAEAEKVTQGKVASTLMLNSGLEEPAESLSEHVSGLACALGGDSGVAELRGEGESLGEASNSKKDEHENGVNKIDSPNKLAAGPGMETNQEIKAALELVPPQQNKDIQKDIVAGEVEGDNDIFQEALDFVNNSQKTTSSNSEPSKLASDTFTQAPSIASKLDQAYDAKEAKVVQNGLKRQLVNDEGGIEAIDKAEEGKDETGGTNEESDIGNTSARTEGEEPFTSESPPDEVVEERNQVEMQEASPTSPEHDSVIKEEQNEPEMEGNENNSAMNLSEERERREVLFGVLDAHADSEKSSEKKLCGEVAEDDVSGPECHVHEERNVDLKDDSEQGREMKSECITVDDRLEDPLTVHEEVKENETEQYNPTQVTDLPTEQEGVDKQIDLVQESASIMMGPAEEPHEDQNYRAAEEELPGVVPSGEESALPESQPTEVIDQEGKVDSEEEDVVDEYHETFDFEASPLGESKAAEQNDCQNGEVEKKSQPQERGGAAEGAGPEKEGLLHRGKVTEDDKKNSADGGESGEALGEAGEKRVAPEEVDGLQMGTCDSKSTEAQDELLEDTHQKPLGEIKPIADRPSDQSPKLGEAVDESQQDAQVGRKGKGKSREDCVVS